MVTSPSSSGWRSTSSADRRNSGNSSRKSTPRWARLTSPGRGMRAAADEARRRRWCGAARGRAAARPAARRPAAGRPRCRCAVTSIASSQRQRRQDARQPARQHGLAGARRADHQHVVRAGGGDLEGALGGSCPCMSAKSASPAARPARSASSVEPAQRRPLRRTDVRDRLGERVAAITSSPGTSAASAAFAAGSTSRGRRARARLCATASTPRDRTQAPSSAELADGGQRPRPSGRPATCPVASRKRQRDRQVERRALLAQVGRREVHGDAPRGELVGRVDDRGAHPLPALLHRGVGQSDDAEGRRGGHDVGLDHHRVTLEAAQGLARDSRSTAPSSSAGCPRRSPARGSSVERERAGQMAHGRRTRRGVDGDDVEAHVADAAQRPGPRREPELGETRDLCAACARPRRPPARRTRPCGAP